MLNVLFIGNSHTYYNDMVHLFAELCKKSGLEITTTMLTSPGQSLIWHYNDPQVRFNILYGNFDYIVLQDAAHPFAGEQALLEGVEKIQSFIHQTTAKTMLYMTWAKQDTPQDQVMMSDAYQTVAKKTNSLLAPVGDCWKKSLELSPNLNLFDDDGKHASEAGSTLVATVIYDTLISDLAN